MSHDGTTVGHVRIDCVRNLPRDFVLVQLGENRDAPCGVGDTVAEALIDLGKKLNRRGAVEFDDQLRKLGGWYVEPSFLRKFYSTLKR